MNGNERMLRLLESLCYQENPDTLKQVSAMSAAYVKDVKSEPDKIVSRKDEILKVYNALKYMIQHKRIPAFDSFADLDQLVETKGWKKK